MEEAQNHRKKLSQRILKKSSDSNKSTIPYLYLYVCQVTHHKARNQTRNTVYKKHKGSLPTFAPISLTPVTEDRPRPNTQGGNYFAPHHGVPLHSADSLFKNQHGRPPGIKEVVYDEFGNVTHVQKINVGAIPDYRYLLMYIHQSWICLPSLISVWDLVYLFFKISVRGKF